MGVEAAVLGIFATIYVIYAKRMMKGAEDEMRPWKERQREARKEQSANIHEQP